MTSESAIVDRYLKKYKNLSPEHFIRVSLRTSNKGAVSYTFGEVKISASTKTFWKPGSRVYDNEFVYLPSLRLAGVEKDIMILTDIITRAIIDDKKEAEELKLKLLESMLTIDNYQDDKKMIEEIYLKKNRDGRLSIHSNGLTTRKNLFERLVEESKTIAKETSSLTTGNVLARTLTDILKKNDLQVVDAETAVTVTKSPSKLPADKRQDLILNIIRSAKYVNATRFNGDRMTRLYSRKNQPEEKALFFGDTPPYNKVFVFYDSDEIAENGKIKNERKEDFKKLFNILGDNGDRYKNFINELKEKVKDLEEKKSQRSIDLSSIKNKMV
ncbi:MAG: hypothetical protein KatS3mg101_0917 [Patescibacteria group bacterium]|nr:MAG: hypothetical protein KatS3mg101_0917 [Patescibacteria group bacterium]